jgi:SAM-dependent methyltransferase
MDLDRASWLASRRAVVEQDYTRDGPTYDDGYDPVTPVHRGFVERLIATTPPDGRILDAACGTGPYMGIVLEAGRTVVGADQSAGMLERARQKHPDVRLELVGLQELAFDGGFHAAMCTDAMEHVPPEEWPLVVANLRHALRPDGHLYLTVEEVDPAHLDRVFAAGREAGLPIVHGEDVGEDTGGYHFYPERDRVDRWLAEGGFSVIDDADEWLDGYGYRHLLVRVAAAS